MELYLSYLQPFGRIKRSLFVTQLEQPSWITTFGIVLNVTNNVTGFQFLATFYTNVGKITIY